MRTTLTLDNDLAGLLKRRARELGIPFKEAVNRTIRAGSGEATATRSDPAQRRSLDDPCKEARESQLHLDPSLDYFRETQSRKRVLTRLAGKMGRR
jgi:hypothetical protein